MWKKVIPPKKGRQHILRIIRDVIAYQPRTKGTDLKKALESAGRIMKHSGVVFVISDFLADDYHLALKRLARRHDVVALNVLDPREIAMPEVGEILMLDPETGVERFVDTSSYNFKKWFKTYLEKRKGRDGRGDEKRQGRFCRHQHEGRLWIGDRAVFPRAFTQKTPLAGQER